MRCGAAAADGVAPKRRIVVTGQGVVTSLGQSVEEFYNKLLAGTSGITEIEGFDTSAMGLGLVGRLCPGVGRGVGP